MKTLFSSITLVCLLCGGVAAQESITLDRGAASGRVFGLHVESTAKLVGGAGLKAAPVELTPDLLKSSSDFFISCPAFVNPDKFQ